MLPAWRYGARPPPARRRPHGNSFGQQSPEAPAPIGEAVCVVREAHPTIGHALSPEQFAENGHAVVEKEMRLHLPTARLVMAAGLKRRVVAVVPNAASLTVTIATTNLIAIVPRRYAELVAPIYRLRILPVPFEYPKTKIFLGWATERADDSGLQWLRGLIRATFAA